MTVPATVLVDASSAWPGLGAQLRSLAGCDAPVVVAAAPGAAVPAGLTRVAVPSGCGRRAALAAAAGAARTGVCIALSPLARPLPGFAAPLAEAVAAGAALAAPVIETAGGDVHGTATPATAACSPSTRPALPMRSPSTASPPRASSSSRCPSSTRPGPYETRLAAAGRSRWSPPHASAARPPARR